MSDEQAQQDVGAVHQRLPPDTSDPRLALLQRGLAATVSGDERDEQRVDDRHQLALAALACLGPAAALQQVPPDSIDSVAHTAHLWCAASRAADRQGMLEQAREWAERAAAILSENGRWRPVLPDWVSQDSARADLCALLVQLGCDRQGAAIATDIRIKRPASDAMRRHTENGIVWAGSWEN